MNYHSNLKKRIIEEWFRKWNDVVISVVPRNSLNFSDIKYDWGMKNLTKKFFYLDTDLFFDDYTQLSKSIEEYELWVFENKEDAKKFREYFSDKIS